MRGFARCPAGNSVRNNGHYTVVEDEIYFVPPADQPDAFSLKFYSFASCEVTHVIDLPKRPHWGLEAFLSLRAQFFMTLPNPSLPLDQQDEEVLLTMCLLSNARSEDPEGLQGAANAVRDRALHPGNRTGRC